MVFIILNDSQIIESTSCCIQEVTIDFFSIRQCIREGNLHILKKVAYFLYILFTPQWNLNTYLGKISLYQCYCFIPDSFLHFLPLCPCF